MDNNEIIIPGGNYYPEQSVSKSTVLDLSTQDTLLALAKRADEYVIATNKIMKAALRITTEYDWILIGGKPYLQESGASKVSRLFGVSVELMGPPTVEADSEGYKTFTYKARFWLGNQYVDCEGARSAKDEFFTGKNREKKPDDIDERDVKLSAYTNCLNNGIKRLIPGLRNLSVDTLSEAGFDVAKMKGYTFKSGSKGGNSGKAEDSGLTCGVCGKAITQAEASYSEAKYGARLCRECQKKEVY